VGHHQLKSQNLRYAAFTRRHRPAGSDPPKTNDMDLNKTVRLLEKFILFLLTIFERVFKFKYLGTLITNTINNGGIRGGIILGNIYI
jgi:hypothetical protein